ncbi:polysaccharide deacetylase familiy protein [Deinococcus aerophilus]|uniref:Polysaccharide deacetylase familiy protein n=1 Tax=Deinococcus aerophilus TaxID=522488 RepID=A0ABQ2GK47_9DEIO|nr:polysaccharide deacetylase familiy protein [Deinococcus aerophilus]
MPLPQLAPVHSGWAALAGLSAYLLLPFLSVQLLNLGVIREGRHARRELALTFDDGPDPVTTPAVLDALQAAGASATFFVIAAHAEAYPHLIARMLAQGHEVAAHADRHVHAWMRTPWDAFLDPLRAVRRLERITGQRPQYHRPPHGAYTLATVLGQRAAGVRGVHWSIEGEDWRAEQTPETVREGVLKRAMPGAVVVLHDAGPGARNTVPMLPELLWALRDRGYTLKTVSQLDGAGPVGGRALVRRAFVALDGVFDRLGGIHPTAGRADTLFRTGRTAFPLGGVTLADGTPVQRGAPSAEFHVNNPLLVDLGLRRSVRQAREDFQAVAGDLQHRPDLQGAQFVYCLSALSPLLSALGFEAHDLPPTAARRLQRWAAVLRRAYGSPPDAPTPRLSILSREAFLARYGDEPN